MHRPWLVLLLLSLPWSAGAQYAESKVKSSLSPDQKWEYRATDISATITEAGTGDVVAYLSDNVPRPDYAKIIWAPDSKRFAFTYSPPHASGTNYETLTVYELRDGEWKPSMPLVKTRSDVPQVTQLAKARLPKSRARQRIWKSSAVQDILRAREWRDPDTLIVYAFADWEGRAADVTAAFLFTFKFAADGKWKLVNTSEATEKDGEAE